MDIKETAQDLIDQGKAALDADADGKVEVKEVLDALHNRVLVTADAAAVAIDEIKGGFDANGDGVVSGEEVRVVAEAAGKRESR